MAQHLTRRRPVARMRLFALLLAGPAACALALGGADPTRPPGWPGASGPADVAGVSGAVGVSSAPTGALLMPTGPVLQSVMISPTYSEAIISGKAVRLGDQIAIGTVLRISDSEVVIRTSGGLQVLKLFPGIDKRDATPIETAVSARHNKTRKTP